MSWKIFFQIILLFIVGSTIVQKINFGRNNQRYQYLGKETSYASIPFSDPNTQKTTYEYIPLDSWGIIDTWTGKVYMQLEAPQEVFYETDYINHSVRFYAFPKGAFDFPPELQSNIDYEKLQEQINAKRGIEKQKFVEDLLRSRGLP